MAGVLHELYNMSYDAEANAEAEAEHEEELRVFLAHGLCMVVAFGTFFPMGAAFSAGWRHKMADGKWLKAHIAVQLAGLVVMLAGLGVAIKMVPPEFPEEGLEMPHKAIGLLLVALLLTMPLLGFFRPDKVSPRQHMRASRRYIRGRRPCGASSHLPHSICPLIAICPTRRRARSGRSGRRCTRAAAGCCCCSALHRF
jgi:hypothetical protein